MTVNFSIATCHDSKIEESQWTNFNKLKAYKERLEEEIWNIKGEAEHMENCQLTNCNKQLGSHVFSLAENCYIKNSDYKTTSEQKKTTLGYKPAVELRLMCGLVL